MISVTLDKEMVKRFKAKVFRDDITKFVPGTSIYFTGTSIYFIGYWYVCRSRNPTFSKAAYDKEFSEWLKIHRPEVFL